MPFEPLATAPKKIAVIGAGISGMAAAHLLSKSHRVVLFEAEPRLGGHARTVIAGRNGDQPVDTGFIVFNKVNYPRLTRFFEELDVPVTKSQMSFGVSLGNGRFEYGLASVDAIFAQRRNAMRPSFLRMLRDMNRFNKRAEALCDDPTMPLVDLLDQLRIGSEMRARYLLPLTGAIWSTPLSRMMDFPAQALIRFMSNHGLMGYYDQHQWYTVAGGSIEYVKRLEARLRAQGAEIRTGCPIATVRRGPLRVEITPVGGLPERFDEVVFATHSDDSLALLADASESERNELGAVRYQPNAAILHADPAKMPKRRKVWSSWVYRDTGVARSDRIDLTYWMNSLQPIPMEDPLFVTLNSTGGIRDELIYDEVAFRHPVYDARALLAQRRIAAMNGTNRTWFCGAWMKHGFHEDGYSSAVDVIDAMQAEQSRVAA